LLDVFVFSDQLTKHQIPTIQAKLKVDTLTVLNHTRFIGKLTPFMITNIDPTTIAYKASGDYQVTVIGIGIGNQEGKTIPTKVTIYPSDGQPFAVPSVTSIPDGVVFQIPGSFATPRFSDTNFTRLRVEISSVVPGKCGPFKLEHCQLPFSFTYAVTLFPKIAVSTVVQQVIATPGTDPASRQVLHMIANVPPGSKHNYPPWATNVVGADPGFTILSVAIDPQQYCVNTSGAGGNPCAFPMGNPGWNQPKNGGATARATGTGNGPAVQLHFVAYEERKITISTPLPDLNVAFAPGESKTVKVRGDAASVVMQTTPAIGPQSVVPLFPPGGVASSFVVCTNRTDVGGGLVQYVCAPKGLDSY